MSAHNSLSWRRDTFGQILAKAKEKRGVALMGVCNVTPDSFSDGGRYFDFGAACAHIDEMIDAGVDIVDIGGESTQPRLARVETQEQIARVLDVVSYASAKIAVSVDSHDPQVAAVCLDAGAIAINDVSCMRNEKLAESVASKSAAIIISHARESQEVMRGFSDYPADAYTDIVSDVLGDLRIAAEKAVQAGVSRQSIVIDPGLGFSKSANHSGELVRRLSQLIKGFGGDVMVGASRKSFLQLIDPKASPRERDGASIAVAMIAARAGVSMLRVHDVRATRQAIDADRFFQANPETFEGERSRHA